MKKRLIIPMLVVMFLLIATTAVFAAQNLADKIYEMGVPYGVTESHRMEMDRYFTNNPVTKAQEDYIIGKANEVISIMKSANTNDVTKLSEKDKKRAQALITDAANHIGLTVSFTDNGINIIGKDGKSVVKISVKSNSAEVVTGNANGSTTNTTGTTTNSTVNAGTNTSKDKNNNTTKPATSTTPVKSNTQATTPAKNNTGKKYVYTGSNSATIIFVSASVIVSIIAGTVVVKLRKNV